ncbi:unnamed protein product [Umbelopsis ramanniana]
MYTRLRPEYYLLTNDNEVLALDSNNPSIFTLYMNVTGTTSLDGANPVIYGMLAIDTAGIVHTCALDGGAMFNGTACDYWYDITSQNAWGTKFCPGCHVIGINPAGLWFSVEASSGSVTGYKMAKGGSGGTWLNYKYADS